VTKQNIKRRPCRPNIGIELLPAGSDPKPKVVFAASRKGAAQLQRESAPTEAHLVAAEAQEAITNEAVH